MIGIYTFQFNGLVGRKSVVTSSEGGRDAFERNWLTPPRLCIVFGISLIATARNNAVQRNEKKLWISRFLQHADSNRPIATSQVSHAGKSSSDIRHPT